MPNRPPPPHLHAVLGFLEGAKKLEWQNNEEDQRLLKELKDFDEQFENAEESEQNRAVPYLRMKRIQKDGVWLLQYKTEERLHNIFRRVLINEEVVFKSGRAPAGTMERLLSRTLQEDEY